MTKLTWIAVVGVIVTFSPVLALAQGNSQWAPPVGIPSPAFGIVQSAPVVPNPWTSATPGFYYISRSGSGATDSSNPYGTPARPRSTIPENLPAGSVVEIHGTYDVAHTSPNGITVAGTASQPVFIKGPSAASRAQIKRTWEIKGSYTILENLDFGPLTDRNGSAAEIFVLAPSDHIALRHSEFHGSLSGGGVNISSYSAGALNTHIVIYNNRIYDNGDVNASTDQDVHGIGVGQRSNNLWIVDNEIHHNSGDGVQINGNKSGGVFDIHHVYLGRNDSHHNKQTGMWTKQAADVVFSENLTYAHRAGNSSFGACMGFQYGPERVWFINNHLHDCEFGIGVASNLDSTPGTESYFIGNVIHNIHSNSVSGAAVMLRGGVNRYVINNTIYDVDMGLTSSASGGSTHIINNIISNVTETDHINLEHAANANNSTMHHNVLGGTVRIKWGSGSTLNLSQFQSATGKGSACVEADPLLEAPTSEDFRVLSASPARDAGTNTPATTGGQSPFAIFENTYAMSIARDYLNTPRPQGTMDIGAHEYGSSQTQPLPRAPAAVRIIR